jgi:hypothetical protein
MGTRGRFRQNGGEVNALWPTNAETWNPDQHGKFRAQRAAPYEKRLDAPAFERFLARHRERLLPLPADERPFLFPFRRLFIRARRRGSAPHPSESPRGASGAR